MQVDEDFKPSFIVVPGGKIRHVAPAWWVAQCHSCKKAGMGKRISQRSCDSEESAREWSRHHLAPDSMHWKYRYPDEKTRARLERSAREEAMLREIFNPTTPPARA